MYNDPSNRKLREDYRVFWDIHKESNMYGVKLDTPPDRVLKEGCNTTQEGHKVPGVFDEHIGCND
jgi:hypothetical protein